MGPQDLRGLSDDGLAAHDVVQVNLLTLRRMLAEREEELASANQHRTNLADRLRTASEDYQKMVKRLQQDVRDLEQMCCGVRKAMLDLMEVVRRVASGAESSAGLADHRASAVCLQTIATTLHAMCDESESRVQ